MSKTIDYWVEYGYPEGMRKTKKITVRKDMEPNVLAAIHRPLYGKIFGVYNKDGKLLYSDDGPIENIDLPNSDE